MRPRIAAPVVVVLMAAIAITCLWWPTKGEADIAPIEEPPDAETPTRNASTPVDSPPKTDPTSIPQPSVHREAIVAASSSAPSLTLAGAIETMINEAQMGSGRETPFSVMDANKAAADRRFNPERKILSVQEERDLAALVARQNDADLTLMRENGRVTKTAMLRSLEAGRIESLVKVQPSETISRSEADRENELRGKALSEQLNARMGKFLEDWAAGTYYTVEPDGVPRANMVYFTKDQAPEVFEVRDRWKAQDAEHAAALRAFFTAVPRR